MKIIIEVSSIEKNPHQQTKMAMLNVLLSARDVAKQEARLIPGVVATETFEVAESEIAS